MTTLLARDLMPAPEDKRYVIICQISDEKGCGLTRSASGKAVLLPNPRHIGEFWAPVSLCRKIEGPQAELYGADIALPEWFLCRENIPY